MLRMSVLLYSCLPQAESVTAFTRLLAAAPPFTTDTKIQFLYVCSTAVGKSERHQYVSTASLHLLTVDQTVSCTMETLLSTSTALPLADVSGGLGASLL